MGPIEAEQSLRSRGVISQSASIVWDSHTLTLRLLPPVGLSSQPWDFTGVLDKRESCLLLGYRTHMPRW